MKEMVSILMLAYNHEKWISQAIESVLKQKTKYSFKLYIHEDCSTDSTREIVMEYYKKFPDIIVPILAPENRYSKRIDILGNIMLPETYGKYIMICEGDDYWIDEYKIELQVSYMEKNSNCELSFGNADIVFADGRFFKKFLPDKIWKDYNINKKLLTDCDFTIDEMIILDFIPTASICTTRRVYQMLNKFSDRFDLSIRLIGTYAGGRAHYFNRVLSAYRTGNPNSASGSINNSYPLLYKHFYCRHKNVYDEFDVISNYKYHDSLIKMMERKLVLTTFSKSYSETRKLKRFDELTYLKKIKEFIKYYFSNVVKIAKKIRYGF